MFNICESMLPLDSIQLTALQKELAANSDLNAMLTTLFQRVTKETAESILNGRYKKFDALIGNFGCQITALFVLENIRKQSVLDEARRISSVAEGALTQTTKELIDFARLRLLCIVNKNLVERGREKPVTNFSAISDDAFAKPLIKGLQIDEAKKSAQFIRDILEHLDFNRADLIRRIFATRSYKMVVHGIEKLPCVYNTEVIFRKMVGLVLIKNKLFLGNDPISGARPIKILLSMPENRLVERTADLAQDVPLIVIEAYIRNESELRSSVAQESLIDIVQADLFYECRVDDSQNFMKDRQVLAHKESLEALPRFMEIDHMYCSSVAEEDV